MDKRCIDTTVNDGNAFGAMLNLCQPYSLQVTKEVSIISWETSPL